MASISRVIGRSAATAITQDRRPTTAPRTAGRRGTSPRSCRRPRRRGSVEAGEDHGAADARPRARAPPVSASPSAAAARAAPQRRGAARRRRRAAAARRPARPGRRSPPAGAVGADPTSRVSSAPPPRWKSIGSLRESSESARERSGTRARGCPRRLPASARPTESAAEERAMHRLDTVVEVRGEGPAADGVRRRPPRPSGRSCASAGSASIARSAIRVPTSAWTSSCASAAVARSANACSSSTVARP